MPANDLTSIIGQRWIRLFFWLLVASLALFALRQLAPMLLVLFWIVQVLQPFLIALIVAYVLHPIVTFVQKKLHLGRVAGIAVLGVSIAGVLIGVMAWLMPVLYQQIASTINDLSNLPATITNYMSAHGYDPKIIKQINERLSSTVKQLNSSLDTLISQIGKPAAAEGLTAVKSVAGGVFGVVGGVTAFFISLVLVVVIAFYYLADMEEIPVIIRRLLPERQREAIWSILVQADESVGGFLRGQMIACAIVGVLTSILLFFFIGMRQYAILIGCFAGLMHLIPYLGPIAGGTPAVLFVLLSARFTSWSQRGAYLLIILIGFSLIEAFDGFVTQPFVVGKRASLHPLAVMLALAVGAQFGIGGMIIAVPAACLVRVLWLELFWKKRTDRVYHKKASRPEPEGKPTRPAREEL